MKRVFIFVPLVFAIAASACTMSPLYGNSYSESYPIPLQTVVTESWGNNITYVQWSVAMVNSSGVITGWSVLATDSSPSTYIEGAVDGEDYVYYEGSGNLWSTAWTRANTGYATGCTGGSEPCPKHAIIKSEVALGNGDLFPTAVYDASNLSCMASAWQSGGGMAVIQNCARAQDGIVVIYAN